MISITQQECAHMHAGTLVMLLIAKLVPVPHEHSDALLLCMCGKVGALLRHHQPQTESEEP